MIGRVFARADFVVGGAIVWMVPGVVVGGLVEVLARPLWPYPVLPFLAYGIWRGATVRVRETEDGLVVRNAVRTYRLSWADVAAVEWGHSWTVPWAYVLPRLTVPERRLPVPVLAMAGWLRPSRADAATVRNWPVART